MRKNNFIKIFDFMKMDGILNEQREKEECIVRIVIADHALGDRLITEIPCREVEQFYKQLKGWY
jgi:hypothetical protein